MGRIGDADARAFLNNRFGAVTMPDPPASYYLGLSTTAPTSGGTNITEPIGDGYARVVIANNTTSWGAATTTTRTRSNKVAVTFPTATGSWGTITHFVLMDAETGGTLRAWGSLTEATAIVTDNTPTFPVDSLVIDAPGT